MVATDREPLVCYGDEKWGLIIYIGRTMIHVVRRCHFYTRTNHGSPSRDVVTLMLTEG